ncbi:hypothetical protein GOBAR_DD04171 [Gossypium barbadense]|nr:hypothetical protein GOBAR_DD04171 [Gossypium barbadense]
MHAERKDAKMEVGTGWRLLTCRFKASGDLRQWSRRKMPRWKSGSTGGLVHWQLLSMLGGRGWVEIDFSLGG